jgi:hypothetical protein
MPIPYKNKLCITIEEWEESGLSYYDYQNDKSAGYLTTLTRGGNGRKVLINFDSIAKPDRKAAIVRTFGNITEKSANDELRNKIVSDVNAWEFFSMFQTPGGKYLNPNKIKQYVANADVLNAIKELHSERLKMRMQKGKSYVPGFWLNIAITVKQLKEELGHNLPGNYRHLQRLADKYYEKGYEALLNGREANVNARAIKDTEQESVMRQLIRKHNNFDNEQISEFYNTIAKACGWKTLTASTVANYRNEWELETYSGRKGVNAWMDEKAMTVKRKAPSYPLYYWTVDGWDVELLYQHTEVDKNGNSRTTYHNRLTVVVVLDPCCKYPIGYAIGTHETPDLIKSAIRNGINHTAQLFGIRHKVLQLQTDNYARKKLQPIYEAISECFTPARVKNAKSKVIEPYFGRLNKKYCQIMPNWSGFGIASGSKNQPNAEYLNKIRNSFPDVDGCRTQIERILEIERQSKLQAYMDAFREMPEEDRHIMDDQEYLYMLGETTGFVNSLSSGGLIATIDGAEKVYDCFDPAFRQNAYESWCLKYDPEDTRQVLAVNATGQNGRLVEELGTKRFVLSEKYVQPMALHERQEGDAEQLQLVRGFNRNLKESITQQMADDYKAVDNLISNNPKLEGTLAKLILTDSYGQHKDNRSASRLEPARKLLQKQEEKIDRQIEVEKKKAYDDYLDKKVDLSKYI